MVQTSSSSQKSPAVGRRVETVELLHLAQLFLDIRLESHQACILTDLIAAATDHPVDDDTAHASTAHSSSGGNVTSPGPSTAHASSGVTAPPAYATQPTTAAATGSISSPGPAAAVGTSAAAVPAPAVPTATIPAVVPVAAPTIPATVVPAALPAVPATAAPSQPATNNGFSPYQVLPATFPYERPSYGTPGPYYAITRGRVVGVVAGWDKASPHCIGVSGAVFRSVPSIEIGRQVVESALNGGSCMLLP
ncbi:hypothetical protein BDZ89DRAFT_1046351 [Hymenopellis radicata]|nr:hypothetical protein BDZ89DRAFT_1046351 [Hymenopellis radicata]